MLRRCTGDYLWKSYLNKQTSMFSLCYAGSKKKLWSSFLEEVLEPYLMKNPSSIVFGDLLSGTGIVAYNVAKNYGCQVVTNDIQYYSYVLNRANLHSYTQREQNFIRIKIAEYNALVPAEDGGFFSRNYCDEERMCFTRENAGKLDAIRKKLEEDRSEMPSESCYFYLLASLMAAADAVSNKAAVYQAYLKSYKETALRELRLSDFRLEPHQDRVIREGICLHANILDVLDREFDVVYLDPPYNGRQYSAMYHILETVSRYDEPRVKGKTRLRCEEDPDKRSSPFCSKRNAAAFLENIISLLKCPIVVLSYSSEGIIPLSTLKQLLLKYGKLEIRKKAYRRFCSQRRSEIEKKRNNSTWEYVFVLKKSLPQ